MLTVSAVFTGRVNVAVAVFAEESVTVTENVTDETPAGGVPERYPAALNVSHEGNPVAAQVYPPLPPEAAKVSEYGTSEVAAGSGELLVMVNAAFTGRVNVSVRELFRVSVTVTRKVIGVAALGMPVSTPLELNANPCGRPVADHVYMPEPPEAVNVSMYGICSVAGGSGEVLPIVSAAFTGNVNIMLAVLLEESVTVALKVTGLAIGAVPLSMPAVLKVNQVCRPVADQV